MTLARPKTATAEERRQLAQGYFDHWFESAGGSSSGVPIGNGSASSGCSGATSATSSSSLWLVGLVPVKDFAERVERACRAHIEGIA